MGAFFNFFENDHPGNGPSEFISDDTLQGPDSIFWCESFKCDLFFGFGRNFKA